MNKLTDLKQALSDLAGSADAEALKGVNATILFDIKGTDGGVWTVDIDDGAISVAEEASESPDVTVEAETQDLVALIRGDLNPMTAFMRGRLKVKGDMSVAMQIQKLFS